MPLQLVRRPGVEVDFGDPAASRAWLLDLVTQEIRLRGNPWPKIYLLGKGFVESLDLHELLLQDPTAHVGATFQELRSRTNAERCFAGQSPAARQVTLQQRRRFLSRRLPNGESVSPIW